MPPELKGIVTAQEAGVDYRFAPDVSLQGDWEGLKISNYQIAGEHAAARIFETIGEKPVLEVCTGIGATTFVLARTFPNVVTVDQDPKRIAIAKENLRRLGLDAKVEFVQGDILNHSLLQTLAQKEIGAVYSDVDWTATGDWQEHVTDITETGPDTVELFRKISSQISGNICMKLPRTINISQLRKMATCEVEQVRPDGELSFYLVYFGDLVRQPESEFVFNKYYYQQ